MATITATAACPTIPGEVRWYPMAATQTFLKGQFLYLDANGRLNVCAASPAGIAGIAMANAVDCVYNSSGISNPVPSGFSATTTNVACPITIAKRGQQFTLNVTSNGSSAVTAISDVGKKYNLYVNSSTKIDYLDKNSSTAVFVVDAIAPENDLGDTYGRVIVEVASSYAQLDQSTS